MLHIRSGMSRRTPTVLLMSKLSCDIVMCIHQHYRVQGLLQSSHMSLVQLPGRILVACLGV